MGLGCFQLSCVIKLVNVTIINMTAKTSIIELRSSMYYQIYIYITLSIFFFFFIFYFLTIVKYIILIMFII
jgi:hypothetical protein